MGVFFLLYRKNIKIIIILLLSCHFATSTLQNKIKLNKNVFFCQIILLYEKKVVPLHRQTKKKEKKIIYNVLFEQKSRII